MTKKQYWELANAQALSVYDAVYASLSHKHHIESHAIAFHAYEEFLSQKQQEFPEWCIAQKRHKKFSQKEVLVLNKFRTPRPHFIVRFAQWLVAS